MASLIKQHERYYLQFYDKSQTPTRKRVALKVTTKRAAFTKKLELEHDYAMGKFDPWKDDPLTYNKEPAIKQVVTMQEAFDQFLETKRKEGKSDNTINSYRWLVGAFKKKIGPETPVNAVTGTQIESYLRDTTVSKGTRHTRFRHLRAFLNWYIEENLITHQPFSRIKAPDKPEKLPKALIEAELNDICQALRKYYRKQLKKRACRPGEIVWQIPMFRFAYFTGLRASELARLKWEHVNFERRLIYILKQKNKKEQTIPLNRKAADILSGISREGPDHFIFKSPGSGGLNAVHVSLWHISVAPLNRREWKLKSGGM